MKTFLRLFHRKKRRRRKSKSKKTEFSKKLAVWASCIATAAVIASYALAAFEKDASDVTTTVFKACIGYLITYAGKSLGEKMSRNKHHLDTDGNPILDEQFAPDDEIHTDQ